MTPLNASCPPQFAGVIALHRRLLRWLIDDALPLWDECGVDRRSGGYFEDLRWLGGSAVPAGADSPRRGRVVARQLYVFDLGRRLGWHSKLPDPVDHGCRYVFSHLHPGDGVLHSAIDGATRAPCAPFSLYEQAFYLFALARVFPAFGHRYPVAATARRCLERLRARFARSAGGFEESDPPTLPLKSNPHMHLLEAALAWMEVTRGADRLPWSTLARELVDLCLTQFRDGTSGAVREYFDADWRPFAGPEGRLIEPGHQFEWSWLLMQWRASDTAGAAVHRDCEPAARRLAAVGERWGVDPERGITVNELWDDLTVRIADARLWPQTERVKAWCAMLETAGSAEAAGEACRRLSAAVEGMARFLRTDAPGLWHEVNRADGTFAPGPSKASSFYHLACAIEALDAVVRRPPGPPSRLAMEGLS
jgi:mannose-6-phosphate isomerase